MVAGEFTRAALATGPVMLSSPKKRVNDAAPREYPTLTWLHRGQDPKVMMKRMVGFEMREKILLSITSRSAYHDINQPVSANITENGVTHKIFPRLWKTSYAWDIYVDEHNDVSVSADGGGQQLEDIVFERHQEVATDMNNFQEATYWAAPNYVEMETGGVDGQIAHSIFSHINEFTSGLPTSIFTGGAWTQFQGLASSTTNFTTNYIPLRRAYKNLTINDAENVISALDYLFEYLRFVPPPTKAEYFEAESNAKPPCVIFTDGVGKLQLKRVARASQDRWEDPTDAFWGEPTFGGTPVVSVPILETVAAFPTGSAGAAGAMQTQTAGVGGSRYFLINARYFRSIYDEKWYMRHFDGTDPQYPTREMVHVMTGFNNFNASPRRHGVAYPANNIS